MPRRGIRCYHAAKSRCSETFGNPPRRDGQGPAVRRIVAITGETPGTGHRRAKTFELPLSTDAIDGRSRLLKSLGGAASGRGFWAWLAADRVCCGAILLRCCWWPLCVVVGVRSLACRARERLRVGASLPRALLGRVGRPGRRARARWSLVVALAVVAARSGYWLLSVTRVTSVTASVRVAAWLLSARSVETRSVPGEMTRSIAGLRVALKRGGLGGVGDSPGGGVPR